MYGKLKLKQGTDTLWKLHFHKVVNREFYFLLFNKAI